LLGLLLTGCLLSAHQALSGVRFEAERTAQALAASDAAARLAGQHAAQIESRDAQLAALEQRDTLFTAQLFVTSAGGIDETYGIARGADLVFGKATADKGLQEAILDHAKAVVAAGEDALRNGKSLDLPRLTRMLPDGRALVAVPYRTQAGGKELAGVAGAVLKAVTAPQAPLWMGALPLLVALAYAWRVHASPMRGRVAGLAGMAVLTAAILALVPGLPSAASSYGGSAVGDWIVPHGSAAATGTAPAVGLWLYLGAALLAAALGLCVTPLATVLDAFRKDAVPYLYVGPAVLATGILIFVPFAVGVGLSFASRDGNFVGMDNYAEVILNAFDPNSSTRFARTLGMTVLWTALNICMHVALGLGLALVLNQPKLMGRKFYRLLLIVPWAVPSYITALTWKWLFNTQYGPINAMLGVLGIDKIDWLGQGVLTNFAANLVTNVWLGFPFMMVISLGALQSIPSELYEAAAIDGAGAWHRFRHITLPLLKPALFPAIILGTIWTFNAFNVIYLVSGGGPDHKTDILITEAYYAFAVLRQNGLAAAYSVLIFLLLLGYTLITNRKTRATEAVNA
jgi:ABC-type sugar transport system permease subunit